MKDLFKILFIKIDGVMVFLFIINLINFEKILIINGVMKNGKSIFFFFLCNYDRYVKELKFDVIFCFVYM